jgi:hypothetical protein
MILIARSAAREIFHEVRRWADHGLEAAGSPLESLLYPLGALVPRDGLICPLELCPLEAIKEIVIDGAAIPPDAIKSFSSHNCHFEIPPEELEEANLSFNAAIDAQLQQRPRLAVLSKLHAHPFANGAFLSSGDHYFGVNAPEAQTWRERRGLATALLHVAYPDGDPELSSSGWRLDAGGARCRGRSGRLTTWRIRSWGLTRSGTMEDLGDATVVSDRHPTVRAARRKPYWSTLRGSRWCDAQKRALRAAGHRVSRNTLGRGWRRYLVQGRLRTIVVALPPDLPAVPPRVLEVVDARRDLFEPLELPAPSTGGSLSRISLRRLVEHFTGPARVTL